MGVALRLAKVGWWQGDPGRILKAPADEVLAAIQYENYLNDYENTIYEMNKVPS